MKRSFDLFVCCSALLTLWPVLAVIALMVRLKLGSPVLFRQTRPGKNAALFTLVKFRTMRDLVDDKGRVLPDAERLERFGKWLRSTSLDELPELWNVIRGDMSLVGPRPLLTEYLPLYSDEQAIRHAIVPGITGLAQISGRNAISWEDKFALDVWYVKNRTFFLDLKILWLTLQKVVVRDGISADGEATMAKFLGTKIE